MRPGLVLLALAACGSSPNANRPDAGACPIAPETFAWPSEDDPQVCSRDPNLTPEAARTQCGDVSESCASDGVTAPDLGCLTGDAGVPPATPATVTLTGYGKVFSSGPSPDGARIEVYLASIVAGASSFTGLTKVGTFDFKLDSTSVADARACPSSLTDPESLHGHCVLPTNDCTGCPVGITATQFCYQTACHDLARWESRYSIPNIPTNTPLVLRSIALTAGQPDPASETWAPLVQYNVYFSTADRACTGIDDNGCLDVAGDSYQFNVNLLSRGDYRTIPLTAGLSAGIAPGHGAIAGEVHDCSDVRVTHAQVGYNPLPARETYFNGNPVTTLPDLARGPMGTDVLGLYAGLDVLPGPIHVVALGKIGGQVQSLGEFTARIWPDTVTIVGINGGKPQP